MERELRRGDKVWVKSIRMTALVVSHTNSLYKIWRADNKIDYVQANGLLRCKHESQIQEGSQETA